HDSERRRPLSRSISTRNDAGAREAMSFRPHLARPRARKKKWAATPALWFRSLRLRGRQTDEGGAPAPRLRWRIAEGEHVAARGQGAAHLRAAHAMPAAVHDAHLELAAKAALVQVLREHGRRVRGRE